MAVKYDMPDEWHRKAVTNQIGKLRREADAEGHAAPSWAAIRRAILVSVEGGFSCACCGKQMLWRSEGTTMPLDSFSIDYYDRPNGHSNDQNLLVTCVGCNAARGRRPIEPFKAYIRNLSATERERVHRAGLHGKIVENYDSRS